MENIQVELKSAIADAHVAAEMTTINARENIDRAINKRIICASLVEKAKQLHKQDIAGYLGDLMTSTQIRAYLSLHDAAGKRGAHHDKRQLLLCGILEQGEPTNVDSLPKPPPSMVSTASSFCGRFNKVLERRPVDEWSQSERDQIKDVLKPVMDFCNNL